MNKKDALDWLTGGEAMGPLAFEVQGMLGIVVRKLRIAPFNCPGLAHEGGSLLAVKAHGMLGLGVQ